MPSTILLCLSAGIILLLGLIHLLYTFSGTKLKPNDAHLLAEMERIPPNISRQTSMWKAWIGFNASHSLGAILFGLVFIHLALVQPDWLLASPFMLIVGLGFQIALLGLAVRFWFSIPTVGIALALVAYVSAIVLA